MASTSTVAPNWHLRYHSHSHSLPSPDFPTKQTCHGKNNKRPRASLPRSLHEHETLHFNPSIHPSTHSPTHPLTSQGELASQPAPHREYTLGKYYSIYIPQTYVRTGVIYYPTSSKSEPGKSIILSGQPVRQHRLCMVRINTLPTMIRSWH